MSRKSALAKKSLIGIEIFSSNVPAKNALFFYTNKTIFDFSSKRSVGQTLVDRTRNQPIG